MLPPPVSLLCRLFSVCQLFGFKRGGGDERQGKGDEEGELWGGSGVGPRVGEENGGKFGEDKMWEGIDGEEGEWGKRGEREGEVELEAVNGKGGREGRGSRRIRVNERQRGEWVGLGFRQKKDEEASRGIMIDAKKVGKRRKEERIERGKECDREMTWGKNGNKFGRVEERRGRWEGWAWVGR